jgi:dipeptide transport system permease protein
LINSIARRDYPALQGGIMLIAVMVIVVNLLLDLTSGLLNPRVRNER